VEIKVQIFIHCRVIEILTLMKTVKIQIVLLLDEIIIWSSPSVSVLVANM